MSKEKQMVEEMAWDLCDIPKHPSIKSCKECGSKNCHATYYAERAINKGYRKQSESVWYFYSEEVECHGPNGVTKKQVTGWICGNCKKYSTGIRNFCPECGAKMKGASYERRQPDDR